MSIPAERLRPGQQIFVRGRLTFGRLASQYTGEELQRRIAQQRQNGSMYPTEVPHTTVNIADAQVLPQDSQNPTLEEQFVQEKIYDIKRGDNAGKKGFGIDDKGSFLPLVFEKNPETGAYKQVKLERELESGLDVTLVLETFAPKSYAKKGLGLSQILVNEPIRYYGGGASTEALAARGIVFEGAVERVPASEGVNAPVAEDGTSQTLPPNTDVSSGLPMPAPGPAPQAAPAAPAPTPAPAQQAPAVDDKDAEIARLKAQLAGNQQAPAAQPQAAQEPSPWDPVN